MTSKTIQLYRFYRSEIGKQVKSYRVRFYSSGCYTIIGTDNVEHEVGTWEKKRMLLENGMESRDKNAVYYSGAPFGKYKSTRFTLKELAADLGNRYLQML